MLLVPIPALNAKVTAMDETLRLEYAYTPAELKEAQELHLGRTLGGGSKWRAACVVIAGIVGYAFIFYDSIRRQNDLRLFYAIFLFVLTVGVALAIIQRQRRNKSKDLTCHVEIDAREIRLRDSSGWTTVPWSAFGKLLESEALFVLPDRTNSILYIFPKRVFPDAHSCNWFRELAYRAPAATASSERARPEFGEPISANKLPGAAPGSVTLEFRLQCRDYLDRGLASWRTRIAMIACAVFIIGVFIIGAMRPPPDADISPREILLYIVPPSLIVMELFVFLNFSLSPWFHQRRHIATQIVVISAEGIFLTQADGQTLIVWDSRICYKETLWSFIIWWPGTVTWLQLPKRSFTTSDAQNLCRDLLASHAQRTTWYFG